MQSPNWAWQITFKNVKKISAKYITCKNNFHKIRIAPKILTRVIQVLLSLLHWFGSRSWPLHQQPLSLSFNKHRHAYLGVILLEFLLQYQSSAFSVGVRSAWPLFLEDRPYSRFVRSSRRSFGRPSTLWPVSVQNFYNRSVVPYNTF